MSDRDTLIAQLTVAERRIARLRCGRLLVRAFTWSLAAPAGLTVAHAVLPVPRWIIAVTLGAWMIGLMAAAVWALWRRRGLSRAAEEVDRAAGLFNELTSALWFAEQGASSPWIDTHIARAARTATQVDVGRLFPWRWPHQTRTAAALLVLLLVLNALLALNIVPRPWMRSWLRAQAPGQDAAAPADAARQLQALVDQDPTLQVLALDPDLARELQKLLDDLRRGDASGSETLERLRRIRQALEKLQPDERGRPPGQGATATLDLKQLEEVLANAVPNPDPRSAGRRGAASELPEMDESGGEMSASARRAARAQLDELQRTLAEAARGGSGDRAGQEAARAGGHESGTPQNAAARGAAAGEGQTQEMGTGAEQLGLAAGSMGRGPSQNRPGVGPPTMLQVKLRREVLSAHARSENAFREPDPTDRERSKDTRPTRSSLAFQGVAARPRYARPEAVAAPDLPWPYRELVKAYFQKVGPRAKHD